jgi:hypothetical protein
MALTLLLLTAVLLLVFLVAPRFLKAQSAPVPVRMLRKRTTRQRR